jgi:hypothetical protein
MTKPTAPDFLDLTEAVIAGALRADDAERQVRSALGPGQDAAAEKAVGELRSLIVAASAVQAHVRATDEARTAESPDLARANAPIATVVAGSVKAGTARRRRPSRGGDGRAPRRTWLLVAATLLIGAGVIGVSMAGGWLVTPTPMPTALLGVTTPSASPAAQMAAAGASATLLADGRVLIAGGSSHQGWSVHGGVFYPETTTDLNSAGLYDHTSRTFTPTGPMTVARVGHIAVRLSDGRVLVAGGSAGPPLRSAELYDPATGTFSPTGPMTDAGVWTAVRLLDGRVLVTGRSHSGEIAGEIAGEIYDPSSGTFSPTGPIAFGGFVEIATLLADGRVLIAGGLVDMGVCSASAGIFDPKTDTFSPTGSMTAPRCGGTATLLQDGRVLMTAGVMWPSSSGRTNQSSAEIFDPKTGTFSPTGSPADGGTGQTATLLADGRVLVAGGTASTDLTVASAELYDPATGTFIPTGSMAVAREGHTATLLPDGRVLVTGGRRPAPSPRGSPDLTPAEIYDPATGTFSPAG